MENPFEQNTSNPFNQNHDNGLSVKVEIPSKTEIKNVVEQAVSRIKEEDDQYLDRYLQAKAMEDISKGIQEAIKKDAIEEAEKLLNDKVEKYLGCTISIKNGATKYDYSDNPEWVKLNEDMVAIKNRLKEIEQEMVAASKVSQLVNADGEVVVPAKIIEESGRVFSVTLQK